MKKVAYFISLLCYLCFSCAKVDLTTNSINSIDSKDKTLFTMYMVGGNLEDDVKPRNGIPDEKEKNTISPAGAGSNDLRELIAGYEHLSEAERANLDIIVAFGGARKKGWQGIKFADIKCLIKDSEDRYFGNDTCYKYSDEKSNMAKEETLEAFFQFIKKNYDTDKRKVVDLWDHGFAYLGVGQDSLNGNDLINLKELKNSLEKSALKFDLFAFDACLMGSIEVAKTIKDFSTYMVASEELEPSHGWNYADFIANLNKNKKESFEVIGKQLVDSYLDNPEHKEEDSKDKTLSLINLKELDNVIKKLDLFSASLNFNNFSKLLSSVENSQKFGSTGKSDLSYTIDLNNWITNIKNNNLEVSSLAKDVLDSLAKLVLYARHDTSKPNANGLSIYSLSKNMEDKYGIEQTFSKTWLDFSQAFVKFGINDFSSPVITEENFSAKSENNITNEEGFFLDISDNIGLRSVEEIFALKTDNRYLFMLGSNNLKAIENDKKYFSPTWNGEWFLLCDGNCNKGLSIFPPAYFHSVTENNSTIYSSDAKLNGEDVVFYFEVSKNNSIISQWAVPYTIGDKGEILLNRNQLKIAKGDTISFYYQVFDTISKQNSWKQGETITFSSEPTFDFAKITADRLYYVQAEDYKGNITLSKVRGVK